MHKLVTLIFFASALLINGCTSLLPDPHKLDIQQGNRINHEDRLKLKLGMTRKQVKFILGTPLLKDGFHGNRWDYIDYFKPGNGTLEQSILSLYFDGDKLTRIDDSQYIQHTDQPEP